MKTYNRVNKLPKALLSLGTPIRHSKPLKSKRDTSVFWKATMKRKGFRETLRVQNA